MKKFIFKIVIIGVLIIAVDFISGFVLNRIQEQCTGGDSGRIKYICQKDTSDILIFGSSRAHYHYNPKIFEDSLHLSCFNCGQNGMGAVYYYGLLKIICENHVPQMVIMDIFPPYDLEENDNSRYLYHLRPYYYHHGIDSIFWSIDNNERYKMMSSLYRYNSRFGDIIHEFHQQPKLDQKGFLALNNTPAHISKPIEKSEYSYDSLKLSYLEKIIQLCKSKNIKLFLTASPRYGFDSNRAFEPLNAIIEKNKVPFLNYYSKKEFTEKVSFFANQDHLNTNGADAFTECLINDIIKFI